MVAVIFVVLLQTLNMEKFQVKRKMTDAGTLMMVWSTTHKTLNWLKTIII